MQPTYYERALANPQTSLATMLDEEIARLKTNGQISPNPEDTNFADGLGKYLKQALDSFKESLAGQMTPYQFELFQHTPAYQEAMVQKAAHHYWTYETLFYFRAFGEKTIQVSGETCRQLLSLPLNGRGADLKPEAPAVMLVFDTPEMVDALYAGERRAAPGRGDYAAAVYVFALEVPPSEGFAWRRLKLLSVHSGPHATHRVEVRRLVLEDGMALEDILKTDGGKSATGETEAARLASEGQVGQVAGALRREDYGFYGARVPYYRAIVGALLKAGAQRQALALHPAPATHNEKVSRLSYLQLS